ncbi:MAG: Asp-tRNA(Asn)/Glu-tRNA(Gln) amidotransferase subunit GatB [Candidatus Micrarchaeaceae archaeon]|nr:Asp-tRNA(Asn)/Glu-tRNA(Gln) amidotransferase subunit GatB [Candidatus Marsarchaeota archaeon]
MSFKIGLEIHVALPTKTKLFCSCNAYNEQEPNISICPICMGFPGSKPMLNKKALELAKSVANALNSKINNQISFERKIYFYPDLPKSYQITQLEYPIANDGYIELLDLNKKINIRRIQLEEDPAKIIHEEEFSLIDFNRSGRPLLEIVTEPDILNLDELKEFLNELKSILYYLGIDINIELKVDLNISYDSERVEIKNITGTRNIINAAIYEMKRQTKIKESGHQIHKQTRSYDENQVITIALREKETEEEYGFIYESDLSKYDIKNIEYIQPVFASKIAKEISLKHNANEELIREQIMFDSSALKLINLFSNKYPINLIVNAIQILKKYNKILDNNKFEKLINLISQNILINQDLLEKIEQNNEINSTKPIDQKLIDTAINNLINKNQKLLDDYEKNNKVFNFIIGQIVKEYNTNPKYVSERLNELLSKTIKKSK